jgi:hypothetical protein
VLPITPRGNESFDDSQRARFRKDIHNKDTLNSQENQAALYGSPFILAVLGDLDFQANFAYHTALFERKPGWQRTVDVQLSPVPEGIRK